MKVRLAACLCLLFGAPAALATDKDGRFAVKGVGLATCQDYARARAETSPLMYSMLGWLDGYLSAYNELSPATFDVAAWESADLFARVLDGHCARSPDDRLFTVVRAIVGQIAGDRLRETSPLVAAQRGEHGLLIYEETLRRVQVALRDQGHYSGAADGQYGDATRAALEAFQTRHNLPVTGVPDQVTLWRLFRPAERP